MNCFADDWRWLELKSKAFIFSQQSKMLLLPAILKFIYYIIYQNTIVQETQYNSCPTLTTTDTPP